MQKWLVHVHSLVPIETFCMMLLFFVDTGNKGSEHLPGVCMKTHSRHINSGVIKDFRKHGPTYLFPDPSGFE